MGFLPDKQSMQLVADAWGLLYRNLWPMVAVFLAKDAAAFILHRLVHRLTNHSEQLLQLAVTALRTTTPNQQQATPVLRMSAVGALLCISPDAVQHWRSHQAGCTQQ
jgi:hypothetical protein